MNILNNFSPNNSPVISASKEQQKPENSAAKKELKPDILDICSEKIINNKDITDTVTMPRAIFKGYLCFTAGTAINAIAGMIKKGKLSKGLSIAGSLISVVGTFNFVKPFLLPEKELTKSEK